MNCHVLKCTLNQLTGVEVVCCSSSAFSAGQMSSPQGRHSPTHTRSQPLIYKNLEIPTRILVYI